MNNEPWYSVRCVFKHQPYEDMTKKNLYEERITVWKTDSIDKAIELAEVDAQQYAKDTNCKFLELSQAFHMFKEQLESGSEVFSLMREHNYSPKKYLDQYFDTSSERQTNYNKKKFSLTNHFTGNRKQLVSGEFYVV